MLSCPRKHRRMAGVLLWGLLCTSVNARFAADRGSRVQRGQWGGHRSNGEAEQQIRGRQSGWCQGRDEKQEVELLEEHQSTQAERMRRKGGNVGMICWDNFAEFNFATKIFSLVVGLKCVIRNVNYVLKVSKKLFELWKEAVIQIYEWGVCDISWKSCNQWKWL